MGKRSDFKRIEKDFYRSIDPVISNALKGMIYKEDTYYEPCWGEGDLVRNLNHANLGTCIGFSDIKGGVDALTLTTKDLFGAEYIITNPPWTRSILHPMIMHFKSLTPMGCWLLFDAPWMFTKQSREYLQYCDIIVNVGRCNWIPGTKMKGKDDVCWYHFQDEPVEATEYVN